MISYFYDSTTARLDSMVGRSGAGLIGRVRWSYDRAGRDTLRAVLLSGAPGEVVTRRQYDSSGRLSYAQTKNDPNLDGGTEWFRFENPTYDLVGNLTDASGREPGSAPITYEYGYSSDGAYRLNHSRKIATNTVVYNWEYDVFGNQLTEQYSNTGATNCVGTAPMDYGPDNRLLRKHTYPGCTTMSRYWTDQTGNRLMETDSLTTPFDTRSVLTYTAANQLYYSVTPTAITGVWDHNWHWYDAEGRRAITQTREQSQLVGSSPKDPGGARQYYLYDGADVALVVAHAGTEWWVTQRFMSGGVDQPLVGRFKTGDGVGGRNVAFVTDRQGTALAAVQPNGEQDGTVAYFGRNAFGKLQGAAPGGSTNTEVGFTGASTRLKSRLGRPWLRRGTQVSPPDRTRACPPPTP